MTQTQVLIKISFKYDFYIDSFKKNILFFALIAKFNIYMGILVFPLKF
jgi:hypothetical protein